MAITATSRGTDDDILFVEVEPTTTVGSLKTRIEFQTSHSPSVQAIRYNGTELADDSKTMEQCGVAPDSMLEMKLKIQRPANTGSGRPQQPQSSQQPQAPQGDPPNVDPEMIRLQALGNPGALAQLRRFDEELAASVQDPARFRAAWESAMTARRDLETARAERQRELVRLSAADDFDIEAQTRIEELIREEQVENERLNAHEFYPECKSSMFLLSGNMC